MQKKYNISGKRIWVAGHKGMVGSAVLRQLENNDCHVITADRQELDLLDKQSVKNFINAKRPQVTILCAAKVGGIHANNSYPVDFLRNNMEIQNNVITACADYGTERLVFLGSSCIYPKFAPQPILETALLTGSLEPTNEWYAIAKIAGIKLCQAYRKQYGKSFISVMPTNLYGPNDNFDLQTSHVLPALLHKIHRAKIEQSSHIQLWGTGEPKREFMHVDDLASAIVFLCEQYDEDEVINVGVGEDVSIANLAHTIAQIVGWKGDLIYDTDKPDGTPRKLMDSTRLQALGWKHSISLHEGIKQTYEWFKNNHQNK